MSEHDTSTRFVNEREFRDICRTNGYDGQLILDLGRQLANNLRDAIHNAAKLYQAHGMAPAEQATVFSIAAIAFANDYGAHAARFVKAECREEWILKATTDYQGAIRNGFALCEKLSAELDQQMEETNMT